MRELNKQKLQSLEVEYANADAQLTVISGNTHAEEKRLAASVKLRKELIEAAEVLKSA